MADAGPILEHPMAKLGFTVMPQSKTIFGLRNRNDVVVLLYSTTDRDNLIWITGGAKKTPIMAISDLKLAFGTRELATVGPDGKKLDKRRDIHLLTHPLTEFGYRVVRMPRMNLNAVWDSEDKMVGFIADDDKDGFCRWDREGATKRETDMPTIKALLAKGRAEKKNAPAAAAVAANEEWRSITKPDAPVPKPSKKKQILKHTLNDCGCVATYSPEDGMYAMVDSKRAPLGLVLESEPTHLYHWNADNTIAQGKLVSEILAEENYKQLMGEEDEPASGSSKKKGKKGKGQPPAPEPAADSNKKKGKKAKDTNPDPVTLDNVTQDDPQPDDPEDEPEGAVGGAPGKKKKPKKSKSKAQSGPDEQGPEGAAAEGAAAEGAEGGAEAGEAAGGGAAVAEAAVAAVGGEAVAGAAVGGAAAGAEPNLAAGADSTPNKPSRAMETLGASPSLTKETAATDDDENPPHNVHDAFGKNTLFVTDGQSRVENPVTWPLMDKSSLHNFQWFYDTRFGNIEVTSVGKDEGKWFTACHYYNKIKQRKCYAFAYRGTRGHFKAFEPDEVVWEKSDNTATLQRYGYQRTALAEKVDHQAKLENDKNCKLITKNNKGIPLHLGVIQATGQQVKAIQGTETGHAYLVAVGAAGFIPKDIAQDQVYVPVKPAKSGPNVTVVNGMQLEKILFESGNLCKPVCCLALTTYSYFQSTIWRLTRDVSNVKPSDLSMLEIGVRGRSSQLFPDFNRKSPDFQYRSAMKALTLVRCFVVLVPEALEVDNMVNVVSNQDVHPVQGEMHIVYLIHSSGRYYSQEVYNNVKLVDIDLATSLGRQCLQRLSSLSIQTKTQDGGEGNAKLETMEDGHLVELPDSKVRGFYNEFWKRVIDPQICHDENQVPLYSRWQHFYRHDFLAQTHLAEPLGNFGPEEIHIVSMANLFQNSQWADTFSFGANINAGERIFLSGAADKNQSATGSPYALYYTYIVQVEVPNDDENIKCIIYDFEGLDDIDVKYHMYEDDGPTKVQACFNEMTKLTWHDKDVPIPERIYFDTTDVFNVRHNQDITVSQTQEDRKHKILAKPKKQVIEYKGRQISAEKWSCLTLNQFYFVSHVGIENKVKVGVANVPINCRAYVTHSRSVCEEFVRKAKTTKPAPPGRGKEVDKTGMGTASTYPIRGCIWDDGREQGHPSNDKIVGIVEADKMGQAMAYSSFRKVNGGEKSTVAFVGKIPYTKYDNQIQLSLPGEPVNEQASIVKAYVVIPSQYGERGDDSSHQIRQVSSTILDVTKGYPVHGFYRLKVRDAQRARDDRFLKILDNTQSFGKSHPKDEYVEMDIPQSGSSSKQGKQGGKGSGQSSKFKHKTTSDGGLGQVFSALALATVSFYLML